MKENNNPKKALVIYGSLAPNASNHHIVAHIKGQWLTGKVRGKLENMGWGADLGYLGFRHTNVDEAQEIKAHILFSDELVENWAYLDDFEGDGYQRILTEYELENGDIGMGYIYAINQKNIEK
jgi:gamma-glutamylcyclotransferase (GGCT)/AIG2-like uncharacterized protein YtfP